MNQQKSKELYEEAVNYLPGGVNSPVRAYKPYPFFAQKAKGSKIYDVDGNEYIDYCLGYGPIVFGHANDYIVEQSINQLKLGTDYGVPSEKEIALAKEVINRVPCAEMVRFTNSGTEATMSAIRLARGVTGKNKIIKFEGAYHGAHDAVLVKSGSGAAGKPDSPGIPEEATRNTILAPFNDENAITKIINENKDEIACIIAEPVMGNIGCVPPKEGYLQFLREITEENNILLIIDEVITGFRISKGGAQEYYDITPDLATFGKIVGGGFPIGAIAGKKEYMEQFTPSGNIYQAGTFSGNPMSINGGLAAFDILTDKRYKELHDKGDYLRNGIQDILSNLNLDYQINGVESMTQVYFTNNEVYDYETAQKSDTKGFLKYFHNLLENGVFIAPSQYECTFISTEHSKEDLDKTLEAIEISLKEL
ncbi:glutamate-1-semialdehyde 2,1-aminomutase [Candidatus Methanosphaera massiliense]|jgi:glutamate-1-semialdehyde 2,1-aminomutase|uniref:glutamate-1-semialdehyde 2,1-aminomutase n=1 Tax=Methanosphaera TaxID=2316 RepID=UPI00238071E4|nr:glutamate-1-semialdehyde 2,1-aminomutase [Candidatus Methanosphaera massiliense]MDD6286266.1 glutamate-1-semialdehyde 2,1-aminomutase [Methanobacteriaceae archaeon]MDE4077569.1 glutamate-1-semialdehyde 2,1-aminomutase [Candidatus Methanosphaera massiliense]MDY2744614.1 glutamate-1-semialdehyde 2,1-aminomutase [Methanosphaera sp.]